MYCQPYLALCIEDTSEVAPCNSEVWLCFNGLQVACLVTPCPVEHGQRGKEEKQKKNTHDVSQYIDEQVARSCTAPCIRMRIVAAAARARARSE